MNEYQCSNYIVKQTAEIGRGGFGYVHRIDIYNADGKKCTGVYAMKTFSPTIEVSKSFCENDLKVRFIQEAKCQAKCAHSNITPIVLHNLKLDNPFFVMNLAECDLQAEITNNSLSNEQKIDILKMILSGMGYLHDMGFIHRDIKPQNILKFGNIYKLSDFGLIKNTNASGEALTAIGVRMGTDKYMAHEIKEAAQYSPRSDIFAIGVVIHDLKINGIDPILARCTAYRPNDRYGNVQEIIDDINRIYS